MILKPHIYLLLPSELIDSQSSLDLMLMSKKSVDIQIDICYVTAHNIY